VWVLCSFDMVINSLTTDGRYLKGSLKGRAIWELTRIGKDDDRDLYIEWQVASGVGLVDGEITESLGAEDCVKLYLKGRAPPCVWW
jgi:hypothetical protein